MKNHFKSVVILIIIGFFFSCSSDGNNEDEGNNQDPFANYTSQICNQASGATAIYWDNSNGLSVPLSQIPSLTNPGETFIHQQYPALSFTMPQGYQANEIYDVQSGAIGVDLIRNDSQVVWRYLPTITFPGVVSADDVLDVEESNIMTFYTFNGAPEVICENSQSVDYGTIVINFSSKLIEFNNTRALLTAKVHLDTTTSFSYVSTTIGSGPILEYDQLVMNDFLPLHWQLMVISDDVRDSDLDGYPDNQDAFPFDPERH